jgi:hypothetical protein
VWAAAAGSKELVRRELTAGFHRCPEIRINFGELMFSLTFSYIQSFFWGILVVVPATHKINRFFKFFNKKPNYFKYSKKWV